MIDGRSVLAVVPARGGSKGIPRKNLRMVGGRPLVSRVGDVVGAVPEIDRSVVSTDDPEIARVAKEAGLDAPFERPAGISGDKATALDVLVHALESTEALDKRSYDIVVLLEPTSPLRTANDVSAVIRKLVVEGWDSVWTVSPTDTKYHPMKQLSLASSTLDFYDPKGPTITARQQLGEVYHRNGVAYAFTRECILGQRAIMGQRTGALVIEGEHVSIDTEWDLELAEFVLARRAQGKAS
jgi:CMP-N,N'-diacetyllegionaminic acid synthase